MKNQETNKKINFRKNGKQPSEWSEALVQTPLGVIKEYGPVDSLADHATGFMIDRINVPKGARASEAGCGTGVISIYMAMAGADTVTGTDIDAACLKAARYNASINNVRNVRFINGTLLAKVPGPLDLVVALLPHKPAPAPFNNRYYGGADGADLLLPLIDQAARRLIPGGYLYLYLNSIANPLRVMTSLNEHFQVCLAGEKKRYFTREEFDDLTPGMFNHICNLKKLGMAEFSEDESGFYFFARVYEARLL